MNLNALKAIAVTHNLSFFTHQQRNALKRVDVQQRHFVQGVRNPVPGKERKQKESGVETPMLFVNFRAHAMAFPKNVPKCSSQARKFARDQAQIVFRTTFALGQATSATKQMFLNQVASFALLGNAVALTQHAAGRLEV